ncbi:MAG TPA: MFS transporter [Atribacterota bacterium]|nr:MFS transporter [Atribacterota bacterium]
MFKKQKNIQLKISLLGHAYNDIYLFIIPLLLPFFRLEFSFTYFQSGLILAIHVALRSIFSLVFGFLGDRFGHKHLFISFGFVLSSILLGSIVLISNLPFMITVLLLLAISVSTFHPLATAMIGDSAKPNKQGRDLSLFNVAGTLGLSIMSLTFGWLVQFWGWRIACLMVSLPGFLLAFGYIKLKNNTQHNHSNSEELPNKKIFITYFISHGLCGLGTWTILSFLPVYATDQIGIPANISAWFLTIFVVSELSGSLIMSKIIDKKNPLKLILFATISLTVLIFALTCSTVPMIVAIIVVLIGLTQGCYYPSQHTWLATVSSNRTRGKIFGFLFFVEGISATFAPFLYGWLADQVGMVSAYRLASIPLFISFLLYISLYYMAKKHYATRINIIKA